MKIDLSKISISTEMLIKLTSIIDKMNIAEELKKMDKETTEELGTELIVLFITNLHKAEKEMYDFVICYKDLYKEPEIDINLDNYDELYNRACQENYKNALIQAKKYDFIAIMKDLLKIEGMTDFLK